jgi:epoxyqueuosine reductase
MRPSCSTWPKLALFACSEPPVWCRPCAIVGSVEHWVSSLKVVVHQFTSARPITSELIGEIGRDAGLDGVGVAPPAVFERARRVLHERKAAGLHGGMEFTYRNPDRSTDPGRAVLDAQAVVVGALSYREPGPPAPTEPSAAIARYAWRNPYEPLREGLWAMARTLRMYGYKAVVFADDNSLVDREAAYRAGLGWFGKNANLLLPGQGSWFVLGAVVTTAPLEPVAEPIADGCGACRRCLDGCPTGAIVAPGVVDAGRCLAWLLQKPGEFPREFRSALGNRLYGCDDCQEVCPPNLRVQASAPVPVRLTRAREDSAPRTHVPLLALLTGTDDEVMAINGAWYLADRNPRWLRRNAIVIAGNTEPPADPGVVAALRRFATADDDLLAEHARWSLERLSAGSTS